MLATMVKEDKFSSSKRLLLAIGYLKKHANEENVNIEELERACGVGVVISDEEIQSIVEGCIEANKATLIEQRYQFTRNTNN